MRFISITLLTLAAMCAPAAAVDILSAEEAAKLAKENKAPKSYTVQVPVGPRRAAMPTDPAPPRVLTEDDGVAGTSDNSRPPGVEADPNVRWRNGVPYRVMQPVVDIPLLDDQVAPRARGTDANGQPRYGLYTRDGTLLKCVNCGLSPCTCPPPPPPPGGFVNPTRKVEAEIESYPDLVPVPEETFLEKVDRLEAFRDRNAIRRKNGRDEAGHKFKSVRPKMSDAVMAEQMSGDLGYPEPTIERRSYPKQPLQNAGKIDGKTPKFAAKEFALDFGNGLKVRRMSFPNEQVAQDWAGAEIARAQDESRNAKTVPHYSGKPRVFEIRGDTAVVVEGDKALDSNIAGHALHEAWGHEGHQGASQKPTTVFAVDDGEGRVARMSENRVVRARVFPNAPIQKDLPEGFPIFEVAGHDQKLDKVLRLFNALSPSSIQRHDTPSPTLANPATKPLRTKKTGAKQKVDGMFGG